MISKNNIRLIQSLSAKKNRIRENLFIVEGDKNVTEVLESSFETDLLVATDEFLHQQGNGAKRASKVISATRDEIRKASLLQNPQNALAVCKLPPSPEPPKMIRGLTLYLDFIQDPGNLGTIIRICDWFGIKTLLCSTDTVDFYNPKVIQATMGSFCRVKPIYTDIESIAPDISNSQIPVYGTFMNGANIYTEQLPADALLVMGNEGSGIRNNLEQIINKRVSIPSWHAGCGAESLNVAVAAGIICAEFRRQHTTQNEMKG